MHVRRCNNWFPFLLFCCCIFFSFFFSTPSPSQAEIFLHNLQGCRLQEKYRDGQEFASISNFDVAELASLSSNHLSAEMRSARVHVAGINSCGALWADRSQNRQRKWEGRQLRQRFAPVSGPARTFPKAAGIFYKCCNWKLSSPCLQLLWF